LSVIASDDAALGTILYAYEQHECLIEEEVSPMVDYVTRILATAAKRTSAGYVVALIYSCILAAFIWNRPAGEVWADLEEEVFLGVGAVGTALGHLDGFVDPLDYIGVQGMPASGDAVPVAAQASSEQLESRNSAQPGLLISLFPSLLRPSRATVELKP